MEKIVCRSLHFLLLFGLIISNSARSNISNRKYCGFQHSDDYVRDVGDISIDEFPWMVQLLYDNKTNSECSGSLINERYVLTAAHCLINRNIKLTGVRLGDHNVKTTQDCITNSQGELECSDLVEDVGVEEIRTHEWFSRKLHQHDIGLIRLAQPVSYTDYIRPICLPQRSLLQLDNIYNLTSSGWGKLGAGLEPTEIKKRVFTKLVSIEECKRAYLKFSINITEDQICGREYNTVTCAGDSGGPLMHSVNNQWEQAGIISFAPGCGENLIVVYANVFNYLDWISSTMR